MADPEAKSETTAELTNVKVAESDSSSQVHVDKGLEILNSYDGDKEWTQEEENKLRRKIDYRLMPILCLTYGLQYYDKAMLGQAALFGLITDLHLNVGTRFSWASSIFYFGFLVGAYPAMVLAQRYPIEKVASGLVTVWGLCLILTVVCTTWQGLLIERFFLGFLEAGISPMFMLIVGSFYTKSEQALRMGIWYSCTGFAGIFSPLINYAFGLIKGSVSSWHYMYHFAGAFTIAWGLVILVILPPDPIRAKGFDQRERYILIARLRTNNSGVRNEHFKVDQVKELLLDIKFWLAFWMATLSMIANAPLSTFSTIIVSQHMGFSGLNALLLTMPVGAFAGFFIVLCSWGAMKFKNSRSYIYFGAQMVTVLASLLLWLLPSSEVGALLFALYILPGLGGGYGVLLGLSLANTAGYTKRSLASSGIFIGYCIGNIIGPQVFRTRDAPGYDLGFIVVVITSIVAAFLGLLYRFLCIRENRKRDQGGVMEGFDDAFNDDLTDQKNPQFRYIL
ncbi:hypothetical protein HYFRA_00009594 [Hymenoscyphus fraxineus]|uniref:Major facilitator superfamily (MFS) profile domain-containing protein n=1 Tax=Hymenoscyphus fraxineus TaxID=746836 RepID=A0A9N9PTX0_9HELO|nr:hypothetical protein HYFRA_00009594 [Hymenoscyphus fraxineus]